MPEKRLNSPPSLRATDHCFECPQTADISTHRTPITDSRRQQLDRMSDRNYFTSVHGLDERERASLMAFETERLRTYHALWPNPEHIDYHPLAADGFYYTGKSDFVCCAFCGGNLGNWETDDDPSSCHKTFFPHCVMVQKKPCGNIPISRSEDSLQSEKLATQGKTIIDSSRIETSSAFSRPTIRPDQPVHQRFSLSADRLSTYPSPSSSIAVGSKQLSEAGFFYAGPGDQVRCFWCDASLDGWEEGDDAWTEHAKWYPLCRYVQKTKSPDFIERCRAELTEEELALSTTLQYHGSDTESQFA